MSEPLNHIRAALEAFAAPAVIVAIASTIVGSVLTYLGIRLNRTRETFETRRYARSLFHELFELNGKVDERVAEFRTVFAKAFVSAGPPEVSSTRELLLKLDEAVRAGQSRTPIVELREFASRVSGFHYSTQAQRTLLIHSLAELLDDHGDLLNSFEKYAAYHAILVSKDDGIARSARWFDEARAFYSDMMDRGEYSAVVRMGITLIGVEMERGLLPDASRRLREIEADAVISRSGFDPAFLRRRFKHLRRMLETGNDPRGGNKSRLDEDDESLSDVPNNPRMEPTR